MRAGSSSSSRNDFSTSLYLTDDIAKSRQTSNAGSQIHQLSYRVSMFPNEVHVDVGHGQSHCRLVKSLVSPIFSGLIHSTTGVGAMVEHFNDAYAQEMWVGQPGHE